MSEALNEIYTPSNGVILRAQRVLSRHMHKRVITPKLDRAIVSFSFDDCPKSVVETALPLLEKEGWLSTIYMSCGLCDTTNHLGLHMSLADVRAVADSGHEIGDHTFNHLDGGTSSLRAFMADIDKNQEILNKLGIKPSESFAYPYGAVKPSLKHALQDRFKLARGIRTANDNNLDLGLAASTRLYHGAYTEETITRIKTLIDNPRWEILFSHDVRDDCSEYGCREEDLKRVIAAVKDSGALVLPVIDALPIVKAAL